MSRQSNKSSLKRVLLTLVILGVMGVLLSSALPGRKLLGATAQKQKTNRSNNKPKANPKPSPSPTGVDSLGAPPPIPKLRAQPEQDVAPGEVISVETTEVMLPVTVRDSQGKLVNSLTRNDFRVFEDSSEQPLSDIALRQVPVDAVLMVDASSSVASNIDDFRRAWEHAGLDVHQSIGEVE